MNNKHHHHNENCGCGGHDSHQQHHHHSSHRHQPEPDHQAPPVITVKTHDASLVGSFHLTIAASFEDADTLLDQALKKIAAEITKYRNKIETPCRTKLLAGCFVFWYTGDGTRLVFHLFLRNC